MSTYKEKYLAKKDPELSAVEAAGMGATICRWCGGGQVSFLHGAWTLAFHMGNEDLAGELDLLLIMLTVEISGVTA